MSEEVKADKSIINPKYRKDRKIDWLGDLISKTCAATREVEKKVKDEEGNVKTVKETKDDGINVDTVFALARANGLSEKVAKFETQRDAHGFAGRFRMTVRNMLQATVKARHGLYVNGEWVEAPAEWLKDKSAPETPTQTPDGVKIAVEKPAKETAETPETAAA